MTHSPRGSRPVVLLVLVALATAQGLAPLATSVAGQNDAGSGGDAGGTFDAATLIDVPGRFEGALDAAAGDVHDFYRFHLERGDQLVLNVRFEGGNFWDVDVEDAVTLLDPHGVPLDARPLVWRGAELQLAGAPVAGEYRVHLQAQVGDLHGYSLCFRPCEGPRDDGMGVGPSYHKTDMQVVIIPPTHGDLGNPFGPSVTDYLDATLRGIRAWEKAIDLFVADHPEYGYLQQIEVDIAIHDGVTPIDPDAVLVVYAETSGPVFRGLAVTPGGPIVLSLFASSPRAGQVLYDYPEINDLEAVTLHEFGHAFGLGHTLKWTEAHGPDLMNSPATFVYGDGHPAGDGGERTPRQCISSHNLYGLAHIFRWIPSGEYERTGRGTVGVPLDYGLYCV